MASLTNHANYLVRHGIRESTARTYTSAQKRYLDFCFQYNLHPLPISEDTLLKYIAFLDLSKLTHGSVLVYLAAVRSFHIEEGITYNLNSRPRVRRALNALRINGGAPGQKHPITFDILDKLRSQIPETYNGLVSWCAMTLSFFGCLRMAEVLPSTTHFNPSRHIQVKDVNFKDNSVIVRIKQSKTDRDNTGFSVHIGCSGVATCAYCSLKQLLYTFPARSPTSPLFSFADGSLLTKPILIGLTRSYLQAISLDPRHYSGHSFRAGCATSAALAGCADYEIQLMGRWTSTAYHRYIRAPQSLLTSFSSRLAATSHIPHHDVAAHPFSN